MFGLIGYYYVLCTNLEPCAGHSPTNCDVAKGAEFRYKTGVCRTISTGIYTKADPQKQGTGKEIL